MVDMRRLLGVLRGAPAADAAGEDELPQADRQPVPDLVDLGTLLSQASQAGLRITLREDGERRVIPSAVGLAVSRIVQESLTNILRHARTTSGSVLLRFEERHVTVTIVNPPPPDGLPSTAPSRPGHGLRGMAERTALFGGTFSAGPAADGGFAVAARFPA